VRIALAQINWHIGNFELNIQKIGNAIQDAKKQKVDLIVFSELAISGYPPRDFLEFSDFIEQCYEGILKIAESCNDIAAIVGSPSVNPHTKGKHLYNTAFFLSEGKISSLIHKTLLPNYDIFDEYRYFEPNDEFNVVEYNGFKIALTICEDIWDIGATPLYTISPMDALIKQDPDVMINIAASPFPYEKRKRRLKVLKDNVSRYHLPLFYVNHVGAQTELLFDGGSMVINKNGDVVEEMLYFEEDIRVFDIEKRNDGCKVVSVNEKRELRPEPGKIELIHNALVMGIRNYFWKLGFKKAILGLSGGIDSAVTHAIAARALGSENVLAVLMPSRYSTAHSIKDAIDLAENLGTPYEIINIEDAFNTFEKTLEPFFKDFPFDVAEENIQSRARAVILMALSNKFGHIVLNTSNKSEAAVGYGTLYGDMCGGLSVLGDVYKTEVFDLARYINKDDVVIPVNSITKPPSAELRHDQKDSDSLPDYDILDTILYEYIEKRQGPQELIKMGFDEKIVRRILRLVNMNEYKRYQTPPMLRVSPKAFGIGRRMPIVAKYLS